MGVGDLHRMLGEKYDGNGCPLNRSPSLDEVLAATTRYSLVLNLLGERPASAGGAETVIITIDDVSRRRGPYYCSS